MGHSDAAAAIGNTPAVELSRLTAGLRGSIIAKLEFLNPGGSKKDRVARAMVDAALASGRVKTGDTILEVTSGNTGTGLAIVCAARGLRFVAFMSEGNTPERRRMMEALGAGVELVPQAAGSRPGTVSGADLDRVRAAADAWAREGRGFRVDQFTDPANPAAHEFGTAEELWKDCGGRIDAFCDFVGSGGTFVGIARGLKRKDRKIRCIAVEPLGAEVLAGKPAVNPLHGIQGGGYSGRPPLWEDGLADAFLAVSEEEAFEASRALARTEGMFAGPSSGANVAAALRLAARGDRVGILLNDSGLKYLSTGLWR
jgi:cysteine synthase A